MSWLGETGKEALKMATEAYKQYTLVSNDVKNLTSELKETQRQLDAAIKEARAETRDFHARIAALEGAHETIIKQAALEALRSSPQVAAIILSGQHKTATAAIAAVSTAKRDHEVPSIDATPNGASAES